MGVIIDGGALMKSSKDIDNALRSLYLEACVYLPPLIRELKTQGGLTSEDIDDKYEGLCQKLEETGKAIASYQKVLRKQTEGFIAQIDEIDRFIY